MRATARRLATVVCAATLTMGLPLAGGVAHGATPAPHPQVDLRLAPAATAISGSWIVVLKDDGHSPRALAQSFVQPGDITAVYDTALTGFAAKMTRAEARELAADPRVAYVEQDSRVTLADAPGTRPVAAAGPAPAQDAPPSWGLDRIDQRELPLDEVYDSDATGEGVTTYVIDTGVRTTHEDFGGRARSGYDFVNDDDNAGDCHGHGTHVAGTIAGETYGVAKEADIVGVKVLSCTGSGNTSTVVAGVDWVTENADGPAVANMSLGGNADGAIDDAVRRSIESGVTYSIAAGNGNIFGWPQDACKKTPARVTEAITVGATDSEDQRASFSNYGTCLDIFAPGVDITSAWIDGDDSTRTASGTSMAAPHVAGAVALYLEEHPSASPAEVRDAVVDNATSDVVGDPRDGSPNTLLYALF